MNNGRLRLIHFAVIAAAIILLTSAPSFSQQWNPGFLVGSWKAAVIPVAPAGLDPFTDLLTFITDGTVIETRRLFVPVTPFGALLENSRSRLLEKDR